jgi:hypothetical protein
MGVNVPVSIPEAPTPHLDWRGEESVGVLPLASGIPAKWRTSHTPSLLNCLYKNLTPGPAHKPAANSARTAIMILAVSAWFMAGGFCGYALEGLVVLCTTPCYICYESAKKEVWLI